MARPFLRLVRLLGRGRAHRAAGRAADRVFAGAFPTHAAEVLAFVQLLALAWRPDHADHDYHAGLRRCPTVADALSGARRRGRLLGAKDLPTFFRQAAGPGWALIGDAAHHKDPLAARGIADALLGAQLLAEQVLRGWDHDLDDALRYYAADLPRRLLPTAQLNDQLAGLDLPIPAARGVLHALWAAEREIATTNLEDFYRPDSVMSTGGGSRQPSHPSTRRQR